MEAGWLGVVRGLSAKIQVSLVSGQGPGKQADGRGFTGTGGADDGRDLAGTCLE